MPKYAIHHIVLNDAIGEMLASSSRAAQVAANDLGANPAAANLGAIGPDLFFWSPDYPIVDKLYSLYRNYKDVEDLYNQIVQPIRDIRDAVVEPVEDAVETLAPTTVDLIRTALEEIGETAELFKKMVSTGLFAGVIEGADLITDAAGFPSLAAQLFDSFVPPLQKGQSENRWYWFDMLHYRRTGDFGRQLVANAEAGSARERAYASGYLSHVGTDLVGHAYVNQVVGGPFRLQVQRHVTSENWMDTWKFQEHYGQNINLELFGKLGLPPTLDPAIGDLLHRTLHDVYDRVDHPRLLPGGDGFLTRGQIDQTYEIFFEVLELMKNQSVARPEEPFSGVADILENALADLFEPPPSPPSSSSGACSLGDIFSFGLTSSSRDCYEEFFDQLDEWFDYLGELLSWAFETLLDLLDLLLAVLLALPVIVLLAILYALQLLIYEIWQLVRSTLALTGFVYPEPADLNDAHGRNLTTPVLCGLQACRDFSAAANAAAGGGPVIYPRLTNLSVSHLVCPQPNPELPTTVPNANALTSDTNPNSFINQEPFKVENLTRYAESRNPRSTRRLASACRRIGNATDLTAFMVTTANDSSASGRERAIAHANWNLDSDRGYGYKTWLGRLPFTATDPPIADDYDN